MGTGSAHHPDAVGLRGPSRPLLFITLSFVGIAVYVLVITHHLRIDAGGLHMQFSNRQAGNDAVLQLSRRPPVDALTAQAFVDRMEELGVMRRYDQDGDQKLSASEMRGFLTDLAKSRILDPQALANRHGSAADLVVKPDGQGGNTAATSASDTQRRQDQQAQLQPERKAGRGSSSSTAVQVASKEQQSQGSGTCPELSRELVAEFAVDKTIMLTVSDWRIFATFGVSWMKHLNRLGVTYFMVGATDKQTSAFLGKQGRHPCFKFFEDGHGRGAKNEYKYGDLHYNAATWRKVVVVKQIVDWGFNVLHSDVDVVWFRDPLPYFLGPHVEAADVAVSTDLISTHAPPGDEGLDADVFQHANVNTGVYFVKSTPGGRAYMDAWAGLRVSRSGDNDQVGLYHFLRNRGASIDRKKRTMTLIADGEAATPIHIGYLASHMLLNGYSYFIPKLHVTHKVQPLGIHLTWVPLSKEGKFHRMRDGMLYNDEPEYYSGPLFLTADLEHPVAPEGYNQQQDTEAMIKFHLKSMDEQLVQMYRVMALSTILNRTLVFPKLKCFCYKNWFMMEQCRIPGDKETQFPLDCELDQWLRPKVLYNYGPNIVGRDGARPFLFREHTLFTNRNFPKELLQQQAIVQPGGIDSKPTIHQVDASELDPPLPGVPSGIRIKVITLPAMMQQNELREVLLTLVGDVKIVRLRKPKELFGGWDDDQLKQSFETFLDKVAGNWCCRDRPFINQGLKEKEKLAIHW